MKMKSLSVVVWFIICQIARAVSPAPDGGYLGNNTAEGQNALFSLTSGIFNTAVGSISLRSDMTDHGALTEIGSWNYVLTSELLPT